VEGLLRSIVFLDLVGLDEVRAKAALLAGVRDKRSKPATAPGFPGHTVAKPEIYPGGTDVRASLYRNITVLRPDTPPEAMYAMHRAAQAIADETDHVVLSEFVQELAARYRHIQDPTTHFWIALAIGKAGTPEAKAVLPHLFSIDDHPYAQYGLCQALDMVAGESSGITHSEISKSEP
jgi:hypothetical protein